MIVSNQLDSTSSTSSADTWIFPSLQMGLFDIHHDNQLTKRFLRSGESGSQFKFGTGYFNPTQDYLDIVLNQSRANYDFLMAHPNANGFLGELLILKSNLQLPHSLIISTFSRSKISRWRNSVCLHLDCQQILWSHQSKSRLKSDQTVRVPTRWMDIPRERALALLQG